MNTKEKSFPVPRDLYPDLNVLVTENGTQDGRPKWDNGTIALYSSEGNTYYSVGLVSDTNQHHFYTTLSEPIATYTGVASTGWINNDWEGSAGDTAYVTCPSSGSATSTPSATSTEALLGSISFGLAVIIGLLFLMVVGFMWNNINQKKPWLSR